MAAENRSVPAGGGVKYGGGQWCASLGEGQRLTGTALLVAAVVGSGITANGLSPGDVGLQLLETSITTAVALGALIVTVGPVSGAQFNPVVSLADGTSAAAAART